nr:penicillin-binding protein activator [Sansalvadorimonas sp. 2012CJ34-2]
MAACSSTPRVEPRPTVITKETGTTTESLIVSASRAADPLRSKLYLQAAQMFGIDNPQRTNSLLGMVNISSLTNQELGDYLLLQAHLRISSDTPGEARDWLNSLNRATLRPAQQQIYDTLQATLSDLEGDHREAIIHWGNAIDTQINNIPEELYINLWYSMLQENSEDLKALLSQTRNNSLIPWLELAIIYRSPEELATQLKQLDEWQRRWVGSPAFLNQPKAITTLQTTPAYQPQSIALLLPLSGPQATAGAAVRDGFMAGFYQSFKGNTQASPQNVLVYDTNDTDTSQLAQQAQNDGAELIIGPLGRSAAQNSLENSSITVPQLILNQVPELPKQISHPVYQFGLASENEARQAAERAWLDGYRQPVLITPDNSWGNRVATTFSETWKELGGEVLDQQTFSGKGDFNPSVSKALLVSSSIKRANSLTRVLGKRLDFTPRRREDIDMIFIAGNPSQGRQLKPALDFYFAYNLPTYTVSSMYSGEIDQIQDRDLNEVRIPLMPWLADKSTPLKAEIEKTWSNSSGSLAPLYALGADAWRIYPRLEQLSRSQGAQMFGATGILTIDSNREVERELRWQYFRNGRPVPLTRERSMSPNLENVLENEGS